LRESLHDTDRGLPTLTSSPTVERFLADWQVAASPRWKPLTAARYRNICAQLTRSLGRIRLTALVPQDVAAMMAQMARDGSAPRTIALTCGVLRAALTDAERWGMLGRNVARLTAAPLVPRPAPKTMDPAKVNEVLAAFVGTEPENLVTLALWTGCRQSELLGLRWADISIERKELSVTGALQRLAGVTTRVETKTGAALRTLALSGPAVAALLGERTRQQEAQGQAGRRWKPQIPDLVFTDRYGATMIGSTITYRFQRQLELAGLAPLRFHHLRHLCGSLLLAAGVDLATVSHVLGHGSVAITASTYAGILPSLKSDAAERLERFMSGQT
jgi:integrase